MSSNIEGVILDDGKITSQSVGRGSLASDVAEGTRIAAAGGRNSRLDLVEDGVGPEYLDYRAGKWIHTTLSASDVAAGMASIANPLSGSGKPLMILDAVVQVNTKSTAPCTANVGMGSGSGTSYDNLLDGIDLQLGGATAPGGYSNREDHGTNGKLRQFWGSSNFVTASMATGATAGFAGVLSLYVVLAESA